jgi:hypothetical protein
MTEEQPERRITFRCPKNQQQKCAIPNRGDLTGDGNGTIYPTIRCKGCGWQGRIRKRSKDASS